MSTPSNRTQSDIYAALDELRQQMATIAQRFGEESHDGTTGTGLTGRIMRIEAKVLAFDRLKERAIGAFMATTVLLAVLWWLARDKLAAVFGVTS